MSAHDLERPLLKRDVGFHEWVFVVPEGVAQVVAEVGAQAGTQVGTVSASAARSEPQPRKRIWVQHVAVDTEKLKLRVAVARARGLDKPQTVIADGISSFIEAARAAAFKDDPRPGRWANWWRGTLVEAAYRNLHTARAQMIDLLDENELRAEIRMAAAREQTMLHRDDLRRLSIEELEAEPAELVRPRLRRLIGDNYESLDLQHAQLRSFRNILLLCAMFILLLVVLTVGLVSWHPTWMPLCFPATTATNVTTGSGQNCPTASGISGPRHPDIGIVAVLGALGGSLAATLSIRNLKGTSTPYDVPVALAMLKVPLGAFTAILALVAIQGDFVPGLSALDSQGQILAYALVFGFAQQALTRLLDQRAQSLLEGLPGGTSTEPLPPGPPRSSKPEPVQSVRHPEASKDGEEPH